jgi:hypothetical protein
MKNKASSFFMKKGNSLIFTGDKLEIFIPERYETHGYLNISTTVRTIGFFDMIINDTIETGYKLAALIEIVPSSSEATTVDGDPVIKLTLHKGDVFIRELKFIKDPKISYILFYEMTFTGRYPKFIQYEDCATIYDYIGHTTSGASSISHTIFEIVAMQVTRDSKNVAKLFRHTSMKGDPLFIGLHSIANVATSTSSRITGAYARAGLEASIANASERNSEIEDALRV